MDLRDRIWREFASNTAKAVEASVADVFKSPTLKKYEDRPKWFSVPRRKAPFKNARIPLENAVTQAILEQLERAQSDQAIEGYQPGSRYPDISEMAFAVEQPPPRRDADYSPPIGDASGRNDLRLTVVRHRLDMRMEAKVILDIKSLNDRYLGAEGLKRFDDQDVPYTTMPFGMMVGYVVDDSRDGWLDKVHEAVRGRGDQPFGFSTFGETQRFTTRHKLPSGCQATHVEVLHLVAEIVARPDARE